jgi:DNA-binding MarR family transcriptional regulator
MQLDVVRELGHLTLGTRLKRLGERLQSQTQRILDGYELPIQAAQFPFLAAIDRLGAATVGELAEAVGLTQPAATRALAQLADAGFVEIAQAEADQRCKSVTLTRRGTRLVELGKREVWPVIDAAARDVCRGASGPLLDQLAAIEDALEREPLDQRARARRR